MAAYYADTSALTFMSSENAKVAASLIANFEEGLEGAEKQHEALEQFVTKRTGQMNKEYKAMQDRLKDLLEKLSKTYATIEAQSKGLNQ